jgi:hypothetical protein
MDDQVALSRARSVLIVLLSACEQALTALDHVDHDPDLDATLHALIEQTGSQLDTFVRSSWPAS